MRKLSAILCSCCLLFMIGGYQLLFCWQQAEIKNEVRQSLQNPQAEKVSQIYLSEQEYENLVWEDDDHKEFTYKGKLNDLVKEQKRNGGYLLSCLADEKETCLVDHFILAVQGANENSNHLALLKLLWQQFIPSRPAEILRPVCKLHHFILSPSSLLLKRPMAIVAPPPDYC